ncbi:hypothetical protein SMGD1_1549 [Sulfurimonas gotlandica GD1]|uniref:Outer membrane porin n=1 Tax=Sulfurimonas gotlandica (strain DSM 19862 / JCM 16533 / GD1) TaxID=929558 RepID=B6BHS2_SULGG|nr:hypothetical protein [Sulfurimonas gotlandica]EDZ63537.1 conserved hypothetical protein [Sulfurimonas gotlandica GD1]EHP30073.1 hypothetical protein SMGD1_1549 [Sulfurimonas gotlandica GD1]
MKKTMVSLAAASLIVTSAMAADKGIDIVTTGQAVVYYETHQSNGTNDNIPATGDTKLFDQQSSNANVGVQLNLDADLKNNFTFGSQLTYLGTMGLEKNLVGAVKQGGGVTTTSDARDQIALTKIFVAKKIGNTTVKLGRQELPKSLSPFAFSEGWNVFKNTFDAALLVNTDIPDTTVVGAYVGGGNSSTNIQNLTDLEGGAVDGTAYMLTVANKSIPMTAITLTYYNLANVTAFTAGENGLAAYWADAKVAGKDLPMGLKIGLQGGMMSPEDSAWASTTALGAEVSLAPIDALTVALAYTSVDGDDNKAEMAIKNTGGIKTPLYTQMVYNQDAIKVDANTFMVKGVYNTGDYGKIIAQYAGTTAGKSNAMNTGRDTTGTDYGEFDLIYKIKASGVQYFAAYVNRSWSTANAATMDNDNIVRLWARLNF